MTSGNESTVDAQVELLRLRVEDELHKPAVIMVTSAQPGDGKSLTAATLVDSFTQQSHRTALVRLTSGLPDHGGSSASPIARSDGGSGAQTSRYDCDETRPEMLASFIDRLRSENDYTIVDAGAYLQSPSTMTVSRLVDGVLVAIRIGRPPCPDDQLMFAMLEHARVRIVGVVATVADAVEPAKGRKPMVKATMPQREVAGSSNGTPAMELSHLSRFFRPNH